MSIAIQRSNAASILGTVSHSTDIPIHNLNLTYKILIMEQMTLMELFYHFSLDEFLLINETFDIPISLLKDCSHMSLYWREGTGRGSYGESKCKGWVCKHSRKNHGTSFMDDPWCGPERFNWQGLLLMVLMDRTELHSKS